MRSLIDVLSSAEQIASGSKSPHEDGSNGILFGIFNTLASEDPINRSPERVHNELKAAKQVLNSETRKPRITHD